MKKGNKSKLSKKSSNKINIKKIKISKKSLRVSSGIGGFDKLTQGGFIKNSSNLIIGGSGSGKSIFGIQFLLEGIKNNETCLYISFEEKKKDFFNNMLELGWDLKKYEEKEKLYFMEYTPEKVRNMLEEGGGTIESLVLGKKVTRLVIDSITSFVLLFESELEKREASLDLFNLISKWDCTSILIHETDMRKDEKLPDIGFESDSIVLFYYALGKKQRERSLEILKMKGTNHSRNIHKYSIGKKGIVIGR